MGFLRPPHVLKGNKGTEIPDRVVFFDTETTSREVEPGILNHTLKLGVACFLNTRPKKIPAQETWMHFTKVGYFWQWVLRFSTANTRILYVAHNLSFDFLVLNGLTQLKAHGWHAKSLIIYHTANIWTFVQYKLTPGSVAWNTYEEANGKRPRVVKTIVFLDMMNYFKMSLAALGEAIGVPKMSIDFDTCSDEELDTYCKNDVFIMVEAWKKWTAFVAEENLGTFGKTLPSQAFNAYRHRFMPHPICIHSHDKALTLERAAYFGGRCECFFIGHYDKGPYYLLDINSQYPFVMHDGLYPTKFVTYVKRGTILDLWRYIESHAVIATVMLDTGHNYYPLRFNKRLTFPVGTFWTTLTTPELALALVNHHVVAVREFALYEKQDIFSGYVDFFWEKRKEFTKAGNLAYREMCKKMLNCLYGKFGQKIDDYTNIAEDETHDVQYWRDYDVEEGKWLKFKCIDGKVSVATGFMESFNSFPAIAAHVTAYARGELLKHIEKAGRGHVFYCDTDSVIVDSVGYEALKEQLSDDILGALHCEKVSQTVTLNNVKDYVFAGKRKTKGITAKAKEVSPNVFGQWQQVSLKAILWNDYTDNCFWKYVEKHLQQTYSKGLVTESGEVVPFSLEEQL